VATPIRDAAAMSEHIIEEPTVKRLERSRSDRMLAGVCGGLARYFGIHPAFYRVGFVVLTLLGGAGILIYLAAALVIPEEGKDESYAARVLRERSDRPWPLVGLALVAIAGAVLLSRATLWHAGWSWILLLFAGAAILWVTRRSSDAAGDLPRVRRVIRFFVIAGALAFAVAVTIGAIVFATVNVHPGRGIGDRTYLVGSAQDLDPSYKLGIGHLKVDLTDVRLPAGTTHLDTRVDIGKLEVIVPSGVALRVNGEATYGNIDMFGDSSDGHDVDRSYNTAGTHVLELDAHVGAGELNIQRAVR
jgi:phage shock protein PspC (stress-responsive transcriptional regulator)